MIERYATCFDKSLHLFHTLDKLDNSNKIEMNVICLDKSKHVYYPLENINYLCIQQRKTVMLPVVIS